MAHILVIGATGPTGLEFCYRAIKEGNRLSIYVRNPSKLPDDISNHDGVTVVKGKLEDTADIERVIASGPTIFVSFAGPGANSRGTPVTDAMKTIFPLLIANKYERAMVLGTGSYTAPQDKGALKWKVSVILIKIIGGSAFDEFNGLGAFVASHDTAQLRWTLFRVPFLGSGPEKPVTATFAGSGSDGMFLSRKSIAAWVLQEMHGESDWIGKTPMLSN